MNEEATKKKKIKLRNNFVQFCARKTQMRNQATKLEIKNE